jgi:hypothetical protein
VVAHARALARAARDDDEVELAPVHYVSLHLDEPCRVRARSCVRMGAVMRARCACRLFVCARCWLANVGRAGERESEEVLAREGEGKRERGARARARARAHCCGPWRRRGGPTTVPWITGVTHSLIPATRNLQRRSAMQVCIHSMHHATHSVQCIYV